ncbi:c-type cytochrome [Roseicella aquatilis]|uniref:Cytochrome c n=1 Tax=Roseicella aquatilis TaxID=2527868 RepID=A0A4R4D490_9PROT|nr:cytochrome c [Roseicella aquatilis]TCZ52758.1 cytochrome c [Roseicella aquatilis]
MSSLHRVLAAAGLGTALLAAVAGAEERGAPRYGYGTVPTPEQIAGWAIAVRPDGQGLPPGRGSVEQGAEVYMQQCAACHGTFGEGEGRYPKLAGEGSLTGERPEPTVGNYWPFATTLFDYINRAMPFPAPRSLSAEEVYATVAYVLNLNNVVPAEFVADRDSLPKVRMPNRDGFLWQDPRPDTHEQACMQDCRKPEEVRIVSTAEGKTLTPRTTGPLDTEMPQ